PRRRSESLGRGAAGAVGRRSPRVRRVGSARTPLASGGRWLATRRRRVGVRAGLPFVGLGRAESAGGRLPGGGLAAAPSARAPGGGGAGGGVGLAVAVAVVGGSRAVESVLGLPGLLEALGGGSSA